MKINREYRIEGIVSPDPTRDSINRAYLDMDDANKPMLVATNGHALVAVPVGRDPDDKAGFVTCERIRAERAAQKRMPVVTVPGTSIVDANGIKFPAWHQVVPRHTKEDENVVRIGIDPQLLLAIADAIGAVERGRNALAPNIELLIEIDPKSKTTLSPILVKNARSTDDAIIAVIMPLRV